MYSKVKTEREHGLKMNAINNQNKQINNNNNNNNQMKRLWIMMYRN